LFVRYRKKDHDFIIQNKMEKTDNSISSPTI
jgi:hypothetical protein